MLDSLWSGAGQSAVSLPAVPKLSVGTSWIHT